MFKEGGSVVLEELDDSTGSMTSRRGVEDCYAGRGSRSHGERGSSLRSKDQVRIYPQQPDRL